MAGRGSRAREHSVPQTGSHARGRKLLLQPDAKALQFVSFIPGARLHIALRTKYKANGPNNGLAGLKALWEIHKTVTESERAHAGFPLQEGTAPFFLQGQGSRRTEAGGGKPFKRRVTASASRAARAPPQTPFRSHQPCVSQSGFLFLRQMREGAQRGYTELPRGRRAAPELRPLEPAASAAPRRSSRRAPRSV